LSKKLLLSVFLAFLPPAGVGRSVLELM